jgi:hypothetical protein
MYQSIPVFSNLSLKKQLKDLATDPKVKSIIFLNCGGTIDLTQTWVGK